MTMSVYCECLSVSSKRQSTLPLFNEKHLCAQTHSTAQEPDLRGKPRGVQASCTQSALAARGEALNVKGKITPSSRRLECDYLQFWKRTPGGLRLIWPRHWVQGPYLKKRKQCLQWRVAESIMPQACNKGLIYSFIPQSSNYLHPGRIFPTKICHY